MAGAKKKKSYRDINVPFQFYVPKELKERASKISDENSLPLAPFMQMAMERFVNRTPEENQKILRGYKRRKRKASIEILEGADLIV